MTILTVVSLLVAGTFAEIAPRKSLEFLDTLLGKVVFFIAPLVISYLFDWPTGLLAAVVSLIVFTRLQKLDVDEGFVDSGEMSSQTQIISSPHRWFIEKTLGERPIAISSEHVVTRAVEQENPRTSSSSSSGTSSHQSNLSSFNQFISSFSSK